jgi:hypothetical protein
MIVRKDYLSISNQVYYKFIYKCTNHYNYLQTHLPLIQTNLQASKLLKTVMYRHKVIKNAKRFKALVKLKLFIVLGLMK